MNDVVLTLPDTTVLVQDAAEESSGSNGWNAPAGSYAKGYIVDAGGRHALDAASNRESVRLLRIDGLEVSRERESSEQEAQSSRHNIPAEQSLDSNGSSRHAGSDDAIQDLKQRVDEVSTSIHLPGSLLVDYCSQT